jgi:hypothetical protein
LGLALVLAKAGEPAHSSAAPAKASSMVRNAPGRKGFDESLRIMGEV